ncbi:MAG: ribose 5-phosphate isomerase B [Sedimentisphaerales bacterium]|nr:ribose 5-phosphate isomerase B [Sedimentisphaerales bacterium]
MKIAIGSDHRGYEAKELIKNILQRSGHEVEDFGTHKSKSCDYPDFGIPAALAVSQGRADLAVLICGSGIGMSITANKIPGIRAALCQDEMTAQISRKHNMANVLCLPAMLVNDLSITRIVESWLHAEFEGGRHIRRVEKMMAAEKYARAAKTKYGEKGQAPAQVYDQTVVEK